jgi:hypothetical protein
LLLQAGAVHVPPQQTAFVPQLVLSETAVLVHAALQVPAFVQVSVVHVFASSHCALLVHVGVWQAPPQQIWPEAQSPSCVHPVGGGAQSRSLNDPTRVCHGALPATA